MTKTVLGATVALLMTVLAGWVWGTPGSTAVERSPEVTELREHLREAHASVLGAHVDLYERDFRSARQQLEAARDRLHSAAACAERLGWPAELNRLDLTGFEDDINEAQRLLGRLEHGTSSVVSQGS